jgi:hypothetical protein
MLLLTSSTLISRYKLLTSNYTVVIAFPAFIKIYWEISYSLLIKIPYTLQL